jgi:hypothetical protein
MKNFCIVAVLFAGLALPVVRADSFFKDGYKLRYLCQGQQRFDRAETLAEMNQAGREAAECFGYIVGVLDGLDTAGQSPLCAPPGVRVGQVEELITRYLNIHIERLHQPAADLIVAALKPAFPCIKR